MLGMPMIREPLRRLLVSNPFCISRRTCSPRSSSRSADSRTTWACRAFQSASPDLSSRA